MSAITRITLPDPGPPMWFFQGSGYDIHLTFANPGPAEVDFEVLSDPDQQYLVSSVHSGSVESSVPIHVLLRIVSQKKAEEVKEMEEQASPEVVSYIQEMENKKVQQKLLEVAAKQEEKQARFEEQCKTVVKGSWKAIRDYLAGKGEDTTLLLALLKYEQEGKNRNSVKALLQDKLKNIRHKKILEAEGEFKNLPEVVGDVKEKVVYNVDDEEGQMIDFLPDGTPKIVKPKKR